MPILLWWGAILPHDAARMDRLASAVGRRNRVGRTFRQRETEHGTTSGVRFHPDPATVGLHDALAHRQTQTGSGHLPGLTLRAAEERLEDALGQFGRNATQAGLTYAESGRVGRISQGGGSPELVLNAQVRGSGYRTYHTVVRYRPTAGWISSTCTCPVRNACKHGVAVMWAAREAGVRLATPSWQRALEQVAEQVRRADVPGTPLALQFDRGSTGQVTLRPLMRGKQGRWVKSGISWDALDRGGGSYVEAHLSLLLALKRTRRVPEGYGYYGYRSDVLNLGELGPQAWSLLAEAAAAGVEFVPAAGVGPVRLLTEPARLVAGLTRDGDEGLVVESRVEADGRRWSLVNGNLIGEPPHGVVLPGGDDLLLGAFDAPLTAAQRSMLLQHPRVRIPADDVAVFAAGFLPALRRVVELEVAPDVELPRVCLLYTSPSPRD